MEIILGFGTYAIFIGIGIVIAGAFGLFNGKWPRNKKDEKDLKELMLLREDLEAGISYKMDKMGWLSKWVVKRQLGGERYAEAERIQTRNRFGGC